MKRIGPRMTAIRRGAAVICVCFGVSLFGTEAAGQASSPPSFMSYQGTLHLTADGAPAAGLQEIEFRLYVNEDDPVDNAVWGERHGTVQVFNGIFNVYLGNGEAIDNVPHGDLADVFTQAGLWLGLKVGLDDEMTPRQRISSVPYAMAAKHVSTAEHGVPPGTIVAFAGPIPPPGWLFCDGTSYARTDFPGLFGAIGIGWGGGTDPGSPGVPGTTFNVPDMRGRLPVGAGFGINENTDDSNSRLQLYAEQDRVGRETHTLILAEIPPHTHSYVDSFAFNLASADPVGLSNAADEDGFVDENRTTNNTGGGQAHNNVQPTASVHYIIKY